MKTPTNVPLALSRSFPTLNKCRETPLLARIERLLACFCVVAEGRSAGTLLEMTRQVADELRTLSSETEADQLLKGVAESAHRLNSLPELDEHPCDVATQIGGVHAALRARLDEIRLSDRKAGLPN
ncbi:MAG: hypothetical protein ACI8UO_005254 [Verrucomicrobiales bacterium]|jgi:hypothetical protein